MATRSRTQLFLQLRQSHPRAPSHLSATALRQSPNLDSEKVGLISPDSDGDENALARAPASGARRGGGAAGAMGVDMRGAATLPPAWVDAVEEIERTLDKVQQLLTQLDALHRKQLLPGFDDTSATERAIDDATAQVSALFKSAQKQIKQFEASAAKPVKRRASAGGKGGAPEPPTPQELKLVKNVAGAMAGRAQALSAQFRKAQGDYMSRLKNRGTGSTSALPAFSLQDPDDPMSPLTDGTGGAGGFTDLQLTQVAENEAAIARRDADIAAIAATISDIAVLFRDMQTMVVEQGTLLDRIDYNVTVAADNTQKANEELEQAERYQVSARKKWLILLLILAVVFVIMLLAIKRKR